MEDQNAALRIELLQAKQKQADLAAHNAALLTKIDDLRTELGRQQRSTLQESRVNDRLRYLLQQAAEMLFNFADGGAKEGSLAYSAWLLHLEIEQALK